MGTLPIVFKMGEPCWNAYGGCSLAYSRHRKVDTISSPAKRDLLSQRN